MSFDILSKIQQAMPDLSKGQKLIAQYIIDHYDKAAYMTASRLGSEVNISESTVVRFAIELGFEGYPELQKSLQELVRTRLTSVQRMVIANDRMGDDVLSKVLTEDMEKIKYTLEHVGYDDFNNAVDSLISAKTIYIIGVRSSAALAAFTNFYFNLIFENVRHINTTSRSEMFEHLMRIGKDDVIVAISFPRYSKRIVNAVDYAKSQGAHVIALTDSEQSPIAAYADNLLTARSDMVSFVDSLVAPLSIINAIIVAIGRKKQTEIEGVFERLENIWDEYDVYEKESPSNDLSQDKI